MHSWSSCTFRVRTLLPLNMDREEQFVLRVQEPELADRIRQLLNAPDGAKQRDALMELKFESHDLGQPRTGTFSIGQESRPVALLDLPCVVESYKTYDDVHLVKSNDIGQMILVQPPDAEPPEQLATGSQRPESGDGVTPAMRNARHRLFASSRKDMQVDPKLLANVTLDLANLAQGKAMQDTRFIDIEEEYQVDEEGNGQWVEVVPKPPPLPGTTGKAGAKKATVRKRGKTPTPAEDAMEQI